MRHHNVNFNVYRDFSYGCNCNLLATGGVGDRPMTQPGWGHAVDGLDVICKAYKDCQKCAADKHGETCIGEIVQYSYSVNGEDKAICENTEGTCKRALCECDATFALSHSGSGDQYQPQYSHYFSAFQYQDVCPNICRSNEIELESTNPYTNNNDLEGTYEATDYFVNDHKCYKNGDNLVVWEVDTFSNPGWVIYNDQDVLIFYSETDTNCPNDAEWVYLPNGANSVSSGIYAPGIFGEGVGVPGLTGTPTLADQQCCHSPVGPHLLYNTYTHVCCANGDIRNIGELC